MDVGGAAAWVTGDRTASIPSIQSRLYAQSASSVGRCSVGGRCIVCADLRAHELNRRTIELDEAATTLDISAGDSGLLLAGEGRTSRRSSRRGRRDRGEDDGRTAGAKQAGAAGRGGSGCVHRANGERV